MFAQKFAFVCRIHTGSKVIPFSKEITTIEVFDVLKFLRKFTGISYFLVSEILVSLKCKFHYNRF